MIWLPTRVFKKLNLLVGIVPTVPWRIKMNWIQFFFGTPTRLFVWLVLAGLTVVAVAPGSLAILLNRLVSEILGPAMTLGLMYLVFRVMWQGFLGGGGGRRRRR